MEETKNLLEDVQLPSANSNGGRWTGWLVILNNTKSKRQREEQCKRPTVKRRMNKTKFSSPFTT